MAFESPPARTRPGRGAVVVAGLLSTLVATTAHAEPTAADRETARSLMQEGRDLREQGDEKGALKRFQAADDIMHVPTTGFEVARSQAALGLLVEARDTIASIRKIPPHPADPEPFVAARANADDLDQSLQGIIPTITVVLRDASPSDAAIAIDGVALLPSAVGLPRKVDPGHHRLVVRAAGGEGAQELEVAAGEEKQLFLRVEHGLPVLSTTPEREHAPQAAATPTPEALTPPARSHGPTAVTLAALGVAAAGLATGTVFGIESWSQKNALSGECPQSTCPPGPPSNDLDAANVSATISTVSFAVAGAAAAVAVASLVIGHAPPRAARATPAVEPWIGIGFAGVRGRL